MSAKTDQTAPTGAVIPATPADAPVTPNPGGTGTDVARPAARPAVLASSLAAESVLDLIMGEMRALDEEIEMLIQQLVTLSASTGRLDETVLAVDEWGQHAEAPHATRVAMDATSEVVSLVLDLVNHGRRGARSIREHNALALSTLRQLADIQDANRRMGAGPKLMATAGR